MNTLEVLEVLNSITPEEAERAAAEMLDLLVDTHDSDEAFAEALITEPFIATVGTAVESGMLQEGQDPELIGGFSGGTTYGLSLLVRILKARQAGDQADATDV